MLVDYMLVVAHRMAVMQANINVHTYYVLRSPMLNHPLRYLQNGNEEDMNFHGLRLNLGFCTYVTI